MKKLILRLLASIIFSTAFSMDYISSPLVTNEGKDFAFEGDIMYYLTDWGIKISDVRDVANPVNIRNMPLYNGARYLYNSNGNLIATGDSIVVFSISNNPTIPEELYTLSITDVKKIKMTDDYCFVVADRDLIIYAVNAFPNLVELVHLENVSSFALSDNRLYTTNYVPPTTEVLADSTVVLREYSFESIDSVTIIDSLQFECDFQINNHYEYIEFVNDVLFLLTTTSDLYSIDCTSEMVILDESRWEGSYNYTTGFAFTDSHLFSNTGEFWDISNPIELVRADYCWDQLLYLHNRPVINNSYLYVPEMYITYTVFNCATLDFIHRVYCPGANDYFSSIAKNGNYLYVLKYTYGSYQGNSVLITLDVTIPELIDIENYQPLSSYFKTIISDDDYLYILGYNSIMIYDLSVPEAPTLINTTMIGIGSQKMVKRNNILYTYHDLSDSDSLSVINVEDVSRPCIIATYTVPHLNNCQDMKIDGIRIYFLGSNLDYIDDVGGLLSCQIGDDDLISNWVYFYGEENTIYRALSIKDDIVLFSGDTYFPRNGYTWIVGPSSTGSFELLQTIHEPIIAHWSEIYGNYRYSSGFNGVYVYDCTIATNPVIVDSTQNLGWSKKLIEDNGFIYVLNDRSRTSFTPLFILLVTMRILICPYLSNNYLKTTLIPSIRKQR
jgi:hypothetical protein